MGHINSRALIVEVPYESGTLAFSMIVSTLSEHFVRVAAKSANDAAALTAAITSIPLLAPINGDSAMILIRSTGSKEGWAPSRAWAEAVEAIKTICNERPGWKFIFVSFGGDDDEMGLIEHSYSGGRADGY